MKNLQAAIKIIYPGVACDFGISADGTIVNWDHPTLARPTQAQIDDAMVTVMAKETKDTANAPAMSHIASIESIITPRRLRDAMLSPNAASDVVGKTNLQWLAYKNGEIALIRAVIIK